MSDHDGIIANDTGAAVRADLNLLAQAILNGFSGASAPAAPVAYQIWHDTTEGLRKQRNAANTGWLVRGNIAETFVLARSANTILGVADFGRTLNCTGTFTQTFTAAATLGDGWFCQIRNNGSGVITLDPNAAETIDGAATLALQPGESCIVLCNASLFITVGLDPAASDTQAGRIEIATQAEQETGTDVTRAVTPGRQQFHPSAAKAWAQANGDGASVDVSYNLTDLTDTGAGIISFNWATDFSTANYSVQYKARKDTGATAGTTFMSSIENTNTDADEVTCTFARVSDGARSDPDKHMVVAFGDQA